jgi:hypothetical protein
LLSGLFAFYVLFSEPIPEARAEENEKDTQDQQRSAAATASEHADLVKQAQNPIASLISLPFQNNTSFGLGEFDRTQDTLLIQPVIPTSLGSWNLINRFIRHGLVGLRLCPSVAAAPPPVSRAGRLLGR